MQKLYEPSPTLILFFGTLPERAWASTVISPISGR